MKEDTLITVIVPIYNMENYLDKCITSITNQTYQNIEILLINDGSEDNSLFICKKYEQQDKRVKIYNQENLGLSAARNKGLKHAKGEYITFIDSDDFIAVNYIELLLKAIKKYGTLISVCDYKNVYETDCISDIPNSNPNILKISRDMVFENMFENEYIKFITAWGSLFHKSIWENIRFPIHKIHEDEFVFHQIYSTIEYVSYVDEKLYFYLQRANSLVHCNGEFAAHPDKIEALELRLKYFEKIESNLVSKIQSKILWESIKIFKNRNKLLNYSFYCKEYKKMDKTIFSYNQRIHLFAYYILMSFNNLIKIKR